MPTIYFLINCTQNVKLEHRSNFTENLKRALVEEMGLTKQFKLY